MKPINPKVKAGAGGSALALGIIALAGLFGVDLAPEAAAAIAGLISFAAGYLKSA